VKPFTVWSTMADRIRHPSNHTSVWYVRICKVEKTYNATHSIFSDVLEYGPFYRKSA
jgi:hypothetical protein